jgi:hypothetical protein
MMEIRQDLLAVGDVGFGDVHFNTLISNFGQQSQN